ncbi:hypothetical protein C0580_02240 [Candidatus Parcubacteria bacterium]|nr:MAG: hypothetical protein C0580_02240 [Candidatus Parcubacteria bacterium]
MEPDLQQKINTLEEKLDSVQKTLDQFKNYFKWTMILSIIFFVLPLIGLMIMLPMMLSTLTSDLSGLL